MSFGTIKYEVEDYVATVTLSRPEQKNAFNDEMVIDLHDTMLQAVADPNARVIILTGAGTVFSPGADVGAFPISGGKPAPRPLFSRLFWPFDMYKRPDYQARNAYLPAIEKPVIGMINGMTAGLGLIYALGCDIRFAAEEAVFSTAFARRAMPAEHGTAWLLSNIVGHANATELLLSGRKFTAQEALEMGLVKRIYPRAQLKDAVHAYAREIAHNCSPFALAILKRELWDIPFQTLQEAIAVSNDDLKACQATDDYKEGARSFLEKRPPRFTGK